MHDSKLNQRWRLLPTSAAPAAAELAAAEALLAGLALLPQPALRWYQALAPALVIGSGQRPGEIDPAACRSAGVSLHRRASGGTAVLFDPGFLMQDLAIPISHPLYHHDVSESYRWLGEVWALTLGRLGMPADLIGIGAARSDAQQAPALVRRACFGGRSPYEVLVGGRKLVGFSQIRRRAGALFQVGLYTHWPGPALADLLALTDSERATLVDLLEARVVGLDALLPTPPSLPAVADAFAVALAERHGVVLEPGAWRADELAAANAGLPRYAPLPI